jgi:hypothetical protein
VLIHARCRPLQGSPEGANRFADDTAGVVRGKTRTARASRDGMLPVVSSLLAGSVSPAPRLEFRCCTCGYGAVRRSGPPRCPMCGCAEWVEVGWKPFAALPCAFVARLGDVVGEAADEPLWRGAAEDGTGSVSRVVTAF